MDSFDNLNLQTKIIVCGWRDVAKLTLCATDGKKIGAAVRLCYFV
jgi:hypothetical protein